MAEDKDFAINVEKLKSRGKDARADTMDRIEKVGDDLGFDRAGPGPKRGRQKSPRTGQVHAKVYPDVAESIKREAVNRGVQQGVLIEEAWTLYLERNRQ